MARPGYQSYGPGSAEYPLDDPSARFGGMLGQLRRRAGAAGQEVATRAGQAGTAVMQRPGMYGALGTAAVMGGGQALQGNLLGAAGSVGGSLAGGGIASLASNFLPAPLGIAAKIALPILGAVAGEQTVSGFGAKAQEAGQRPGGGPDVEVAGVPLTETAAIRKQRELDRAQTLQDIQQLGGAELALNKELLGYIKIQEIEQAKAMAPLMERAQRAQLTNAQAMLNSQTAAYQQLGRTAMMGKLAAIGQQERGATMRQALATNPYIGATLQAPQINFG